LDTCITFDDISPYRIPVSRMAIFLKMLNTLHVPSTLFVIPNDSGKNYSKSEDFVNSLKQAKNLGHELAQHGYFHKKGVVFSDCGSLLPIPYPSFNEQKNQLEIGKRSFEELTGFAPYGFRAPNYRHNASTLKVLSHLNFKYDSSKTVFKPVALAPVRIRVARHLKPVKQSVLEIPVTGDYTLNCDMANLHVHLCRALADFELVKSKGGVFVLNNHPNHVDSVVLSQFLSAFVEKTKHKTNFVRLCDIDN
jgi:predicted deacetylase